MELYGESDNHTLDERGRVFVPNRFKPFFEMGGFLTRAFNGQCLVFYPGSSLESFKQRLQTVKDKLAAVDATQFLKATRAADDLTRFVSCGVPITLDGQGRLAIPPTLRRRATLETTVTFVALGDRLEIWDEQRWLAYDDTQLNPDALDQTLSEVYGAVQAA